MRCAYISFALAAAHVSLIQLRDPAATRSQEPEFRSDAEGKIASVRVSSPETSQVPDDEYFQLAALGPRKTTRTLALRTSQRQAGQSEAETIGVCPEPNSEPLQNDIALSSGEHVTKTIFEGPRVFFLAGLEGTGHHLYRQSLAWAPTGFGPDVFALFNTRTTSVCGPEASLGENCGPVKDSDDFMSKREILVQKLKTLHSGNSSNKVYGLMANGDYDFSYPFGRDGGKAILTHPDVRVLAEVAEMAEIDFRVVILTRSAKAMLHSTVTHRGFCSGPSGMERQGAYLIHNANVLSAQLSRIDKGFVVCARFEDLPQVSEEFAELFDAAVEQPSGYTQSVLNEQFDEAAKTHEIHFTAAEEEIVNNVQESANGIFVAAQC